nr:DUF4183 domain-containing protein [Paenibacillus castaneae]
MTQTVKIPANQFTDDAGGTIAAFNIPIPNGYSNLFINGILQLGSCYTLNQDSLQLTTGNDMIFAGTPIIIETIGFVIQD